MRALATAGERGCPVCGQRVIVVGGLFVRHHIGTFKWTQECWGSYKLAEWRQG